MKNTLPASDDHAAHAANAAGMAAIKRGDFVAAKAAFEQATHADPGAGALWRNLAHACREIGDVTGERVAIDRALGVDRRDIVALLRSAQQYERVGDEARALTEWSNFLQLAAASGEVPASFGPALDHARGYVAQRQQRLAARIDADLGPAIEAMEPGPQRRIRAFVDRAIGRRTIYANECSGLYYPFLPADEFFDEAHFPWFAALEAETATIRSELEALLADGDAALRPYVRFDEGTPENKWTPLDGSLNWSACFLWEYGEPNRPVLDRCPATARALEAVPLARIPGRAPTAFFSLLRPKARIPAHTGVSNTRAIVHLPLIVPTDCGFRVGGETREWIEGRAFAFDDTIEHEAWNGSDELRAVLILDVWNPHLSEQERDGIAAYYASADATGLNPERAG